MQSFALTLTVRSWDDTIQAVLHYACIDNDGVAETPGPVVSDLTALGRVDDWTELDLLKRSVLKAAVTMFNE